jgi:hypothetical protein
VAAAPDFFQQQREVHGLDRSALEFRLNAWGQWIEEHSDYEGYPRADAVHSWAEGFGGGQKGHRVLCLVMPKSVASIHLRICNALTEAEREAVWIRYVTVTKDDGSLWSKQERCAKLGITVETLERYLTRARRRLLGLDA